LVWFVGSLILANLLRHLRIIVETEGERTWDLLDKCDQRESLSDLDKLFDSDVVHGVHFVRLYYEFVKPGEGLECDTAETSWVKDELMELPINGFTCTRVFLIHVLIQII
jgi:hypothetical protein